MHGHYYVEPVMADIARCSHSLERVESTLNPKRRVALLHHPRAIARRLSAIARILAKSVAVGCGRGCGLRAVGCGCGQVGGPPLEVLPQATDSF